MVGLLIVAEASFQTFSNCSLPVTNTFFELFTRWFLRVSRISVRVAVCCCCCFTEQFVRRPSEMKGVSLMKTKSRATMSDAVQVSVRVRIPPLPPLMATRRCSGCLAPAARRPSTWKHLVCVTSARCFSLSPSLPPSLPHFSTCVLVHTREPVSSPSSSPSIGFAPFPHS